MPELVGPPATRLRAPARSPGTDPRLGSTRYVSQTVDSVAVPWVSSPGSVPVPRTVRSPCGKPATLRPPRSTHPRENVGTGSCQTQARFHSTTSTLPNNSLTPCCVRISRRLDARPAFRHPLWLSR
ncbi:hypothetical protein chiPu_0031666, partial [Chiloscyllium punctatum]|nr:hypothetical protein [Chiloscyllium punctatum]